MTTSPKLTGFRLIANSGVCYKPSLAIWSLARQPPELPTSTLEPHFQKDRARPCSQTRVTQITNIVVTQCTPNVHAGTFQVTTVPNQPTKSVTDLVPGLRNKKKNLIQIIKFRHKCKRDDKIAPRRCAILLSLI